jgi:hypothetical protein
MFFVIDQQIDAHQSPLAAMAFSSNGMYLATASEKGTMVRVHIVAQATKVNICELSSNSTISPLSSA